MLEGKAPLYYENLSFSVNRTAHWLYTIDKVKVRIGLWESSKHESSPQGTVFILPGRTEYIEKYGKTADIFVRLGYRAITIDWRGQGLADRSLPDQMIGDVTDFSEYQKDLDALIHEAHKLNLPKPWFLLAHSMGGCIALRAMHRDLAFVSASFTGPMWGIVIQNALLRPFAKTIAKTAKMLSLGTNYAPSTTKDCYCAVAEFEGNTLTPDPDMWAYICDKVLQNPELQLGGPSIRWFEAALRETDDLASLPSPKQASLCYLGDKEQIVSKSRIIERMKSWGNGRLIDVPNAKHEILMMHENFQKQIVSEMCEFFQATATTTAGVS